MVKSAISNFLTPLRLCGEKSRLEFSDQPRDQPRQFRLSRIGDRNDLLDPRRFQGIGQTQIGHNAGRKDT